MKTPYFIEKIDWSDLREQKRILIAVIDEMEKKKDIRFEELQGILNLIDAAQDYAVDEMGINEMHIYDFELEEQREMSTPTEIFAKDSAEKIFDELLESDGFHTDDKLPSEFIETIMADNMHADIIRGLIRIQILRDVLQNPEAFKYDDKEVPIYDADMRDDYEGIAANYCREIFDSIETKTIYICTHCQSDNVQVKAWTKPNEGQKFVDEVQGDEIGWCDDCQLNSVIETVSVKASAKVIGYQVVGEDGTEEEGEIHPQMDASFCLYNLGQARAMLNDKNGNEQWQLLSIWIGDVEEPTMMFKGDPRNEDLGTTDGHIDPTNR